MFINNLGEKRKGKAAAADITHFVKGGQNREEGRERRDFFPENNLPEKLRRTFDFLPPVRATSNRLEIL